MSVLVPVIPNPNNPNLWQRPHELENLQKQFGEVSILDLSSVLIETALDQAKPDIVFWKIHTERTTLHQLNVAILASLEITKRGIPQINNPIGWINAHAKDQAFTIWGRNQIPCPPWSMFERGQSLTDIPIPALVRIHDSNTAEHSYLIRELEELAPALEKLYASDWADMRQRWGRGVDRVLLYTKFIDAIRHGYRYSYRIIVAGDTVVTGYARLCDPKDWVAITSHFTPDMGDAFIQHNAECQSFMIENKEQIIKSVHSLGLNFQGVDVIFDNDRNPYYLEVQPEFSCGNVRYGAIPPWYNPSYPELVKFIHDNEHEIQQVCSMYYFNWLDKDSLFQKCFQNLAEYLV